jgi:hypothetical protein
MAGFVNTGADIIQDVQQVLNAKVGPAKGIHSGSEKTKGLVVLELIGDAEYPHQVGAVELLACLTGFAFDGAPEPPVTDGDLLDQHLLKNSLGLELRRQLGDELVVLGLILAPVASLYDYLLGEEAVREGISPYDLFATL